MGKTLTNRNQHPAMNNHTRTYCLARGPHTGEFKRYTKESWEKIFLKIRLIKDLLDFYIPAF